MSATQSSPEKLPPPAPDYEADDLWRQKPLTPAHVVIHDITIKKKESRNTTVPVINEIPSTSLVPDHAKYTTYEDHMRVREAAQNPIEQQRFEQLEQQYGWIKYLRLEKDASAEATHCRWTHVSSKYPEYIAAFYWSLTDHTVKSSEVTHVIQAIDDTIERNRRHSKHGQYFIPFIERLLHDSDEAISPTLISCPWLDWSIPNPPPLRFQIDRREGFQSTRSSRHLLRSILQHYYRLEDTTDREEFQVFSKHKPWVQNKDLDLRIRRWYGQYPTSLVVDELWILIIDATNIVTFSSNATWKSRWPPLQLSARISNISFRNFRNTASRSWQHGLKIIDSRSLAVTCLSGAIGMLHRSFWPDMPLCLTDRFAGYLGHLQYRLHRAPSTKLVMSLISCYDELNIVIQITQQQLDLLIAMQEIITPEQGEIEPRRRRPKSAGQSWEHATTSAMLPTTYTTKLSSSRANTPLLQAIDNLQRELVDLEDLRDNTNALIMRTIQLVNIRLEDNGKSILVFTVITIIFLPLNFIASFFGMNVSDIRNLDQGQGLFWIVAVCVTAGVAALAMFVAFQGGNLMERYRLWHDTRHELRRMNLTSKSLETKNLTFSSFAG